MWKSEHKRAIGLRYERKAEEYLRSKGYRILGRNLHFKGGEIDLVCEGEGGEGGILVFVEVRMRDPRSFSSPEESLCGRKKSRLRVACNSYLARYRGAAREIRIDLVSCDGEGIHHRLNFISF